MWHKDAELKLTAVQSKFILNADDCNFSLNGTQTVFILFKEVEGKS